MLRGTEAERCDGPIAGRRDGTMWWRPDAVVVSRSDGAGTAIRPALSSRRRGSTAELAVAAAIGNG
jgi:hypothetical protein